jgi:periplasmic protein TonB
MDISLAGAPLAVTVLGIVTLIFGLIVFMRYIYGKKSAAELAQKYKEAGGAAKAGVRTKFPEVDVFGLSGTFFNLGLVISLALTILAFSWTQYEDMVYVPEGALEYEEDIMMEPPRTAEPPPPPPPPPPPVIEEVPEEQIIEEQQVEFVDQSVEEKTVIQAPVAKAPPPPPPPPPPPDPVVEEIFKVVEEMPRFPGCEDQGGTAQEKKACADKKMLEFIYKNIKYPAIARENGVEGTVVIQFVVERDGTITDSRIVRDIGAQCGQESLRVVNLMNDQNLKWTPGKQRGRAVRVQFNLPVKFKLE